MNEPREKASPQVLENDARKIHFLGICGKAMGGIAAALAQEGWDISGSDEKCYAPMKDYLSQCGISISMPYAAENLPADAAMVVVGKRVAASNPELLQVLSSGQPHCSFPQFLHCHFLSRSRNAVVAGGVGKTTTTAMLAWILEHSGWQPDYLIGGVARNFPTTARFAGSGFAVLEGDEYASCFDDPQPKFLHYQPEVAIITNIVEDHPDLYGSFAELCAAFSTLIATIPTHGCLIIPDHDAAAATLAQAAGCQVTTVGLGTTATAAITKVRLRPAGSAFRLMDTEFEISFCGQMNVSNAAMAAVAAAHLGVKPAQAAAALRLFQGVENRQEEQELGNCTLVCDKASHPYALEELAHALRQRFPARRLVSVMQPRATGGRDWVYQRDLPQALALFDQIILTSSYEHNPQQPQRWANDPFCLELLATSLTDKSAEVMIARTLEELSSTLNFQLQDGDVVVLTVLEQSAAIRQTVLEHLRGRMDCAQSL